MNIKEINIIGNNRRIIEILNISRKLKNSDASVFIFGESGTGKELLARYIHEQSIRGNKKFIAINCAAIPDELLENELFGHKKGAFTDAETDYIGKFGYANGGTLFLDEIGEMSINLQAKLLRVLQFKEYEPIGSTEIYNSDVRIIAATNRDIKELLKENKIREDLYYRLNVVPINIPPLRQREDDIELLAKYYLEIYNKKSNKNIKGFQPGVINILRTYNWPGNIRELQNVIERAVLLCNGEYLEIKEISLYSNKLKDVEINEKSLKNALEEFKREYIIKILEKNNWNQTKTARVLKIQRTYLSRLVKELKIDKI